MRSDTRLLNGRAILATADNALATATAAAMPNMRHFVAGVAISYSAAGPAGIATVQIKLGTTVVLTLSFDRVTGFAGKIFPLPVDIHGDFNQAVSAELSATGTGGVIGSVTLFVSTE